jgi:uncharacterized membrane protein YqjE
MLRVFFSELTYQLPTDRDIYKLFFFCLQVTDAMKKQGEKKSMKRVQGLILDVRRCQEGLISSRFYMEKVRRLRACVLAFVARFIACLLITTLSTLPIHIIHEIVRYSMPASTEWPMFLLLVAVLRREGDKMHACPARTFFFTPLGRLAPICTPCIIARLAVIYEVDLLRRGAVAYEDPPGG